MVDRGISFTVREVTTSVDNRDQLILTTGQIGAPAGRVRVRLLLEVHAYGTGPGNVAIAQAMRGSGLLVNWSPATFRLSHDKYAIADGTTALIGTANWTHSAFVSNREYLVADADPV